MSPGSSEGALLESGPILAQWAAPQNPSPWPLNPPPHCFRVSSRLFSTKKEEKKANCLSALFSLCCSSSPPPSHRRGHRKHPDASDGPPGRDGGAGRHGADPPEAGGGQRRRTAAARRRPGPRQLHNVGKRSSSSGCRPPRVAAGRGSELRAAAGFGA